MPLAQRRPHLPQDAAAVDPDDGLVVVVGGDVGGQDVGRGEQQRGWAHDAAVFGEQRCPGRQLEASPVRSLQQWLGHE